MEDAKNLYKDDALVESKEVEDDKGNDASGTRMLGRIGEVVGALADSYDKSSISEMKSNPGSNIV